MAELSQSSAAENAGGKVRAKKQSTKIDMTPMVDLAFLLLTFFILTTYISQAQHHLAQYAGAGRRSRSTTFVNSEERF